MSRLGPTDLYPSSYFTCQAVRNPTWSPVDMAGGEVNFTTAQWTQQMTRSSSIFSAPLWRLGRQRYYLSNQSLQASSMQTLLWRSVRGPCPWRGGECTDATEWYTGFCSGRSSSKISVSLNLLFWGPPGPGFKILLHTSQIFDSAPWKRWE